MPLSLLRFDMRAPELTPAENRRRYGAAIEMAEAGDAGGIDIAVLSEHHASPDGYLPSPLILASAIAARTTTLMVSIQAVLVPLHDPVRLAEDLAILDLISGGRVSITTGLGYRPVEYALYGKEWKRRGRLLDEAIETMLAIWAGEPVTRGGESIEVTPLPLSRPHPHMMIGGNGIAAVERAARFGLTANLGAFDPSFEAHYLAECERLGTKPRGCLMPAEGLPTCVFISEDPDRTWAEVGPHMLHDATVYESWSVPGVASSVVTDAQTIDDLRSGHVYSVMTPEEAIPFARENPTVMFPLVGGADPKFGWESLQLFIDKVKPHL